MKKEIEEKLARAIIKDAKEQLIEGDGNCACKDCEFARELILCYEQGKKDKRERILKLIDELDKKTYSGKDEVLRELKQKIEKEK